MACPRARHSGGSGGCSSTGRAPPLHGGGQGFESPHLHQACCGASRAAFPRGCPGTLRPGESRPGESRPGESRPGESRPGESRPGTFQTEQKKRRVASIELSRGLGVSLGLGGSEELVEGSYFGRQVDAWALWADEGRGKAAKSHGESSSGR